MRRLARDPAWALFRLRDKIRGGDLFPALLRKAQALLGPWVRLRGQEPIKRRVVLPTVHDIACVDPSEAIRSHEIVEVVQRYCRIVEFRPLGGNLLHFLLDGIAHNFPDDDPKAQSWLQVLFALEDAFLAEGLCPTDFALIVAVRPGNAADGP